MDKKETGRRRLERKGGERKKATEEEEVKECPSPDGVVI